MCQASVGLTQGQPGFLSGLTDPVSCLMVTLNCVRRSGVGPMQGQAGWFLMFAPVQDAYGMRRYYDEVRVSAAQRWGLKPAAWGASICDWEAVWGPSFIPRAVEL